jgi:hypothetical protein
MAAGKGEEGRRKASEGQIQDDLDALFQLPLSEFTAARNVLAGRLKKNGHADAASQVKSLAKPPASAWAVNLLYWRHRDAFDRLVTTGEQFRTAQASLLAGKSADLRGPLEARRVALAELSRRAASVLRDAGSTPAPETMRRVTTTLEALSVFGTLADAPRAGRLTDDVDPPGFEALAALVPSVGRGKSGAEPTRIIPFQRAARQEKPSKRKLDPEGEARRAEEERKARVAAAKDAVQEADRALREARATARSAEEALKKAAARAKEADQVRSEAEQRLQKAAADADAARQQARKVAAQAEEAAQALEDAEGALEKATRALNDLS